MMRFVQSYAHAHAHAYPHTPTRIRMRMVDTGSSPECTEHSRVGTPAARVHDGVKRLEMRHHS